MSKRANGEGTYFKRKDGRWQGQHSCRGPLGEPVRKTVYGRTQAEVRQKLRALEQQAEAGVVTTGRASTVAAYGEQWLDGKLRDDIAQGHLAEGTRINYSHIWKSHVEPDLGHLRLDALGPQVLRIWMTGKTAEPSRLGRPLSERTRQLIFAVLRKALNDAVRDGLIARNPLDAVRAPKVSRRAASPLTSEEVAALLRASEGGRLHPLVVLMLGTGARPGEALAAAWSQVDLDAAQWTINRTLTRLATGDDNSTRLGFKATKTPASEATVGLPQAAVAVLRQHRAQQGAERLAARVWADPDLVFTTSLGTPLEPRNVLRQLKVVARDAGIERNVRLHDLRHAAASGLLAEGVDITVTSKLLRHTRLATTADIYSHLLNEVREEAAVAMDGRLKRLLG